MESQEHEREPTEQQDETPEEFAEDLENDPARNPDDDDLERVQGG